MSILYDEGQQVIASESRRVLEARASKDRMLALLEQTGACDDVFWNTAVEQGWTALAIGEEHGGLGLGRGLPRDHHPDKGVPFNQFPA